MPKQGVAGRKVAIVFEEVQTGAEGGARFRFYLDGISSSRMTEINNMTDREKAAGLSPPEFYACSMFAVVADAMVKAGVVRGTTRRS